MSIEVWGDLAVDLSATQAIIFDMGGTLYDIRRESVVMVRFFLRELGLTKIDRLSDKQIERLMEPADGWFDRTLIERDVGPHWLPTTEDWIEYDRRLLTEFGVKENADSKARECERKWAAVPVEKRSTLLEGCKPVLEELKSRGYKLGIASNRHNDPSARLAYDCLTSLFGAVEYSCVPGYKKPSPYMLVQVASALRVSPRKCVYVGDSIDYDVEAAMRADMIPILLAWCNQDEASRVAEGTTVIGHIRDILEIFP